MNRLPLVQIKELEPEELEKSLLELRKLTGPFPFREDLAHHLNLARGRVTWAFNSFAKQLACRESASKSSLSASSSSSGSPSSSAPSSTASISLEALPSNLSSPSSSSSSSPSSSSSSSSSFPSSTSSSSSSSSSSLALQPETRPGNNSLAGSPRSAKTYTFPLPSKSELEKEKEKSQESFIPFSKSLHIRSEDHQASSNFHLPEEILLLVFSFLSLGELLNCGLVCKLWLRVSSDDALWRGFVLGRWRCFHPSSPPLTTYKELYYHQLKAEKQHQCPKKDCEGSHQAGSVVPIVYGFPSQELIEAARKKKVVMGSDHIPVKEWNMPIWGCTVGMHSWKEYPWL